MVKLFMNGKGDTHILDIAFFEGEKSLCGIDLSDYKPVSDTEHTATCTACKNHNQPTKDWRTSIFS